MKIKMLSKLSLPLIGLGLALSSQVASAAMYSVQFSTALDQGHSSEVATLTWSDLIGGGVQFTLKNDSPDSSIAKLDFGKWFIGATGWSDTGIYPSVTSVSLGTSPTHGSPNRFDQKSYKWFDSEATFSDVIGPNKQAQWNVTGNTFNAASFTALVSAKGTSANQPDTMAIVQLNATGHQGAGIQSDAGWWAAGTVIAVPEPEEYGMMLLGFGMVGYQIKRKQKQMTTRGI